ncbi:MAG: class II aldolase [Bacteroidales bacterium]|nr:MAG: class II aldolase [Bacteroidales bacterium]
MDTQIKDLVEVSRFYGVNKEFVIAGGGNTSFKNNDYLWVKASGVYLSNINTDGFVCLARDKLKIIYNKKYSTNSQSREAEVKNDLNSAMVSKNGKRPSVESSLHDIIDYPFVVHTHPTLVNALLCSNNARSLSAKLFGSDILYIEYVDPGYVLFKKVSDELVRYRKIRSCDPKVILIENHGIFVSGETIGEIKSIYSNIENTILNEITGSLPANKCQPFDTSIRKRVVEFINSSQQCYTDTVSSDLISEFTRNERLFKDVDTAFTPDHIVYCKARYLFIDDSNEEKALEEITAFSKKNGYYSKIIAIKNKGLLIIEENESALGVVRELILNMMKISFYARSFGGSKPLFDKNIAFIENWEAENYRKQMMNNSNK